MDSIFNKWIYSEYEPLNKSLPIFRVIYALYMLLIAFPNYVWISKYPDTFFLPRIGLGFLFSGFPSVSFFYLLNFLLILSLLALLIGYRTFYSSLAVAIILFVGNTFLYSFGKVNHDIPVIIIPLLFSFSCWGKSIAVENDIPTQNTWPISIFALLLGLAMFTAAMAKILSGWLDPSISALAGHLVRNYFVTGHQTITSAYLLSDSNFYFFKFLDYGTVAIETAFILTVISLRYFRLVCAMACLFHFGVQLTMEISFITNIIAYAAFVDWSFVYRYDKAQRWLGKLEGIFENINLWGLLLLSSLVWLFYTYNPFQPNFRLNYIFGGNLTNSCIMIFAVILAVCYLYRFFNDKFRFYFNPLFELKNNHIHE